MKIPNDWLNLFPGDRIHSTLPFHRITQAINALGEDGFRFETEPSAKGYWLICRESPNVSPYKSSPEAA